MRREICIRQIELSNGMGQIELFCISSNQNRTPSLGLRKLDPEKGGKQGELTRTCTCLKCIPKGWLVVWPTREVMTPLTYFKCSLGLGFGKPKCCFSYLDKQTF
jgi:hypothetical protein